MRWGAGEWGDKGQTGTPGERGGLRGDRRGRGARGKPAHAETGWRGIGVRGWDPLVGAEDPSVWAWGYQGI